MEVSEEWLLTLPALDFVRDEVQEISSDSWGARCTEPLHGGVRDLCEGFNNYLLLRSARLVGYGSSSLSCAGYGVTVVRFAVRGSRAEPKTRLFRTANDGIFSLAIWIFWGYDDLVIHSEKDLN